MKDNILKWHTCKASWYAREAWRFCPDLPKRWPARIIWKAYLRMSGTMLGFAASKIRGKNTGVFIPQESLRKLLPVEELGLTADRRKQRAACSSNMALRKSASSLVSRMSCSAASLYWLVALRHSEANTAQRVAQYGILKMRKLLKYGIWFGKLEKTDLQVWR